MKSLLTVIALAISCAFMILVFLFAPMPTVEPPQPEQDYPKPKYEPCMQERDNEGKREILLFPNGFMDGEFYQIVEKDETEILYIFPLCGPGKIYRLHQDGLVTLGMRP